MAVPIFVFLMIEANPNQRYWATGIFILASFTDWLDGYLARLYRAETILGKLLDPLADKVIVMAALVMLVAVDNQPRVPAWIVVLLLSREIIVTGLRSVAAVQGTVVAASQGAKYKTAFTMVSIVCLLLGQSFVIPFIGINSFELGIYLLWISLVLSLWTGFDYAYALRKVYTELGTVED